MGKTIGKSICPCCGGEVVIKSEPAKWQGQGDKITIEHQKWQKG